MPGDPDRDRSRRPVERCRLQSDRVARMDVQRLGGRVGDDEAGARNARDHLDVIEHAGTRHDLDLGEAVALGVGGRAVVELEGLDRRAERPHAGSDLRDGRRRVAARRPTALSVGVAPPPRWISTPVVSGSSSFSRFFSAALPAAVERNGAELAVSPTRSAAARTATRMLTWWRSTKGARRQWALIPPRSRIPHTRPSRATPPESHTGVT